MRPKGNSDELEFRRKKAKYLLEKGTKPSKVAERLGVTPKSVYLWRKQLKSKNKKVASLEASPQKGRVSKLSLSELYGFGSGSLRLGPQKFGYRNERWTLRLINRRLKEKYKIIYDPSHLLKIYNKYWEPCILPQYKIRRRSH
jgi:transposase